MSLKKNRPDTPDTSSFFAALFLAQPSILARLPIEHHNPGKLAMHGLAVEKAFRTQYANGWPS